MATIDYNKLSQQDVMSFVEQLKQAGFVCDAHEDRTSNSYFYSATNDKRTLAKLVGISVSISYQDTGETHINILNYDAGNKALRDNNN